MAPRLHRKLAELPIYRDFRANQFRADLFHHINHRHYLRQGLRPLRRTVLALDHFEFESRHWSLDYRKAIYAADGIELWRHDCRDQVFSIRLLAASRALPEGDLRVCLFVGQEPLHNINFSWVRSTRLFGQMVPFVARCQGRWRKDAEVQATFDACFPNNSGAYFTYAALQGIAQAVGAPQIIAVRSHQQCCFELDNPLHFANAYDRFWEALGGRDDGLLGYTIPYPLCRSPWLKSVPNTGSARHSGAPIGRR